MKHIIIFLFLLITSCQKEKNTEYDYIANYYQKIYKADFEYQTENYQKAFDLYQDAFNSCPPINTPIYNELVNFAQTCAILRKNELAIEFIKKKIERGYEIKWLQQNEKFHKVFVTEQGKKLVSDYDNLRQKALSKINLSLREEIKQMKIEDQKYRNAN